MSIFAIILYEIFISTWKYVVIEYVAYIHNNKRQFADIFTKLLIKQVFQNIRYKNDCGLNKREYYNLIQGFPTFFLSWLPLKIR